MEITLNGERRTFEDEMTIQAILREAGLDVDQTGIAVAVSGSVVQRREWDGLLLKDGDRVDIIRAVQGG